MFLALKNGLGRLAIFFRGLFDEYGGAAAAYSLRRLGSAYSGPLVRVRRDSDDAELDFTSTTSIADWVNGKLETTLPADVATSSAAYSLRKVKAGYTGDAVRIRRASDDVEVNVAFDTTGVVSANSAITNVTESPDQGDTTATTLGGFLTEGGNQDAYVHTWYDQAGSNHATQDTSGDQPKIAEAGALLTRGSEGKATIEFGSSLDYHLNVSGGPSVKSVFSVLEADNTNFETLICDTSDNSPRITSFNAANNRSYVFNGFGTPSINVNGSTYDGTSSVTSFGLHILGATSATGGNINRIGANPGVSATGNSMDFVSELVLYNSDQSSNRFKIESNINNYYGIYTASHNGFVHTWYDQSGNSNDATQDTLEDEQPKIVSAGSLLADGIDFDGVDDKLNFTALSASDLSIFSVVTFDSVAGQERIIGPQSGANEGFGIGNATTGFFRASGTANSPALNATISADTTTLYSLIRASNTGTFFTDSTASTTFSNSDTFAGASLGGASNPVDGSLKEIIIYTSDQTANRSGIESNIADEYGITLP